MPIFDWLGLDWLGLRDRGLDVAELARRLDLPPERLENFTPRYRERLIPKRSGDRRRLLVPDGNTCDLQRRIMRRLLARLRAHPSAVGFERGRSIVDAARPHVGRAVVVRLDVVDFFPNTSATRVRAYLRAVGWNRRASALLARLCTHEEGLPQGAPTSPRLSNLVNYLLDARIRGLADVLGAEYTRYADDITFSLAVDDAVRVHALRRRAAEIVADFGYRLHVRRKSHVRRRHQQQLVTGLVVNEKLQLPRKTRRWLRAVEHRAAQNWRDQPFGEPGAWQPAKRPTLSDAELQGWRGLVRMIEAQRVEG